MGFLSGLVKAASKVVGGGGSLKSAYLDKQAPIGPGVYQIRFNGQLMKVGKASNGLRKRFSDYYRGAEGGTAALKYITSSNRDQVRVTWKECSQDMCRKYETQMYDFEKAKGEELPWSDRR